MIRIGGVKQIALVATVFAALFGSPAVSKAGLLSSLVTVDGADDLLQDASRGQVYDTNKDGYLGTKDVIYGMMRIHSRVGMTDLDADEQLIVVYAFEVEEVTHQTYTINQQEFGQYLIKYKGSTIEGYRLKDLIDSSHTPAGYSWTGQEGFAVFEQTPADDPLLDMGTGGKTLIQSVSGADSGYTLDMIGGFTAASNDFFDNFIDGRTEFAAASLANVPIRVVEGLGSSTTFGSLSGGLSVLWHNLDGVAEFLPAPVTSVTTKLTTNHQVTISQGNLSGYDASNWSFTDKATITLNPTPTPASGVGILGMSLVGGLIGLRRWRSA